ncbi:DnaD domain-containing protein [Lactobacillus sp. PV034]|uniref:DnaD domain-containing protein n=1 Tax=Lactobacillus sp. PV034 TaxID=2594495 RepID=UPI00223EFCB2|nr:DnaD domain protein [Lactobacillus sp. PV034]QNQ80410.1 DnaD domain protein [Lactobacillus sp. PV034]
MANFYDYRRNGFSTFSNVLFKYYSKLDLSEIELVLLLQLEVFDQEGNYFPSNQNLAAITNLSAIEVSEIIQGLINKEFISLEQTHDSQGKINNYYSLKPFYEKLDQLLNQEMINLKSNREVDEISLNKEDKTDNPIQRTVRQFEIEFGRLLSPIERQEIAAWINEDHYDPEVIKLALRESVLAQIYNFKYVDRILLNWQRHNLRTVEQVKNYLQRNV